MSQDINTKEIYDCEGCRDNKFLASANKALQEEIASLQQQLTEKGRVIDQLWEIGNGSDYDELTMKKMLYILGKEVKGQFESEMRSKS